MSIVESLNDDYDIDYRVSYRPCAEERPPGQRNIMQRRSYLTYRARKAPGSYKGMHQRRRRRDG